MKCACVFIEGARTRRVRRNSQWCISISSSLDMNAYVCASAHVHNTASPRYVDGDGRKRVRGGPGLKGTQFYPPAFTASVVLRCSCDWLPFAHT